MKICGQIFRYEIGKLFADRKLLASIILMPVVVVLITAFLSGSMEETEVQTYHIYALNNMMKQQKVAESVEIIPVDYLTIETLAENVELATTDVVLAFAKNEVIIYYNTVNSISKNLSNICKQMILDQALSNYAQTVDISERITIEDINTQSSNNSLMAILLPYMLVLLLFQTTAEYAVDTIAGEKERGVFSKTLLAPISPVPIICGKLIAATVCGLISSGAYMLIVIASSQLTGIDSYGMQDANITPVMVVLMVVCAVLLSGFFAGLAVMCSLHAKTVKEAQSMKIPVYGVTMVLALMAMLRMGKVSQLHYAIPVYNICIIMQDVLSNVDVLENMLITVGSLLACTLVAVTVTVLSFNKESIRY